MSTKDFSQTLQSIKAFQTDSLELIRNWSMLVDDSKELDVTFNLFNGESHTLPNVLKVINSFNAEIIILQDQIDAIEVKVFQLQGDVIALKNAGVPVGTVISWAGTTGNIPIGWLNCNGATFDTAAFPDLTALIPSGVTPDLQNVFVMGASGLSDAVLLNTFNQNEHALSINEMPIHNHTSSNAGSHVHTGNLRNDVEINPGASGQKAVSHESTLPLTQNPNANPVMLSAGDHSHSIQNMGGGLPVDMRPRYLCLNYIIKADNTAAAF